MTTTTRADAQRARVLSISTEIFSRQGFRATSMNEIAAAVGLSKPTLYHYFRSKEELLVRIYSEVLDESLEGARKTVAAAQSPLTAIRDLIAERVAYTCEKQQILKVCFEEEHELPAHLADELLARRKEFEDLFASQVEAHQAQHPGTLTGVVPRVYVNACLGAINWCYKWYRPSGPATPAELGRQIAATLSAPLEP
ncbi:MAG TPA: TetR/AcrR family transcriptional regulator [Sporichthya sp.]|nr:TetR/AcrR family transcriptional regulator [Sporichthya sp.]